MTVSNKFRTFLPSDPNAPDFIKELYQKPPIDFEIKNLDVEKLKAFERLTTELCHDFTVYSGMFGSDDARKRTSKLGGSVVAIVERSMLTQICLRYSALVHDQTRVDKHRKKRTNEAVISFRELIEPLNSSWLNDKRKEMESFYEKSGLKKWRNKVIAHNDYKLFKSRDKHLPEITSDLIEKQLELINECVNYLRDNQHVYTEVPVYLEIGEGFDKYNQTLDNC